MDLNSRQEVKPGGWESRHRHGCSAAQAKTKGWQPELNAAAKQMGPSPCLALLPVLLTALRGTLSALALITPGGRVAHRGPDTSSQEKDNAHCVHLQVLGEFLRTLYPSYQALEEMLCKSLPVEHLSTCNKNWENSVHAFQVKAVFFSFLFFLESIMQTYFCYISIACGYSSPSPQIHKQWGNTVFDSNCKSHLL